MPSQKRLSHRKAAGAGKYYPIQVKQKDKTGRPDIDAFEAGAFFKRTGRSIVLFTVDDILNEQLARKLA